jgi:Flp pilus assembly pilin Flp
MAELLKKLMQDDSGQDLAEYGIALAVIGAGAGLAAIAIGDVNKLWSVANSVIGAAAAAV